MLLAARKGLQEEATGHQEPGKPSAQPRLQQQPPAAPSSSTLSQPAQQLSHRAVRMLQHAAQQLLLAAAAPGSVELLAAACAAVDAVTWRLQGTPVMESPQPVQQQQQQQRRPQVLNLGAPAGGEGVSSQQVVLSRGPSIRPLQQPDSALSPRSLGLPPRPPSAAADTPRSRRGPTDACGTSHAATPVDDGVAAVAAPPSPVESGATNTPEARGTDALQSPNSSRDNQQKGLTPPAAAGPSTGVASTAPGCGAPGVSHGEGSWTGPDEAFTGKPVAA
jgi:hypothetical protein